ncbi:hypothetical protein ACIQWR_09075 [Streptomyces sp. NPDC098789]
MTSRPPSPPSPASPTARERAFVADVVSPRRTGPRPVVVHSGGPRSGAPR